MVVFLLPPTSCYIWSCLLLKRVKVLMLAQRESANHDIIHLNSNDLWRGRGLSVHVPVNARLSWSTHTHLGDTVRCGEAVCV